MYKAIFEILTGQISLLANPIQDKILVGFILLVAFKTAYSLVGSLYRIGVISDREEGSFFHYLFRFIIVSVLTVIAALVIGAYRWFTELPPVKWWVLGGMGVVALVCYIAYAIYEEKQYRAALQERSTS